MTHAERAALCVMGLDALPDTEAELAKAYKRCVKQVHPDAYHAPQGIGDKPIKRVYRAHEILYGAIVARDKPKVYVCFGAGKAQQAVVIDNPCYICDSSVPEESCKYMTTVKWFMGLNVCVGQSEWQEINEPQCLVFAGVFIRCL